jgi:predicted RNase H-like nuclease (RuvC/YqgF family)
VSIFSKKTDAPANKPTEFSFETPVEANGISEQNTTSEKSANAGINTPSTEQTKKTSPKHEATTTNQESEDLLSIEKIVALFNSLPPVDVTIATVLIKQTLTTVGVDIHKVVQQLKDRLSQHDHQESQIQKEIYVLQQKLSELTQALSHSEEKQENLKRILFLLTQHDTHENFTHSTLNNTPPRTDY